MPSLYFALTLVICVGQLQRQTQNADFLSVKYEFI